MFFLSILLLIVGAVMLFVGPMIARTSSGRPVGLGFVLIITGLAFLGYSTFTVVPASNVGVVTKFGQVQEGVLPEGGHFVMPWLTVNKVYVGMDQAEAKDSQAGSKDLQSVHATLSVNYNVDAAKARELFMQNPSLMYEDAFVVPAIAEIFKAIVAQYTAEELVTKRQEVSAGITQALNARLLQYHLHVQTVNLVNFGFSRAFDASIEEKVTASQKAQTAQRNLERVKFEVDARIAQATGEAQAIAIQAAAVEKQGGQAYIQLKALEKWNGVLPTMMGAGPTPFINVTGKQP